MAQDSNDMNRMIEMDVMIIIKTSAINRTDDVCKKKKNVFQHRIRDVEFDDQNTRLKINENNFIKIINGHHRHQERIIM